MTQNSRNILLDITFAPNSLTKISSADMREFVNYVYDDFMTKDNIADDLTTQDSTIALSARQGTIIDKELTIIKDDITDAQNAAQALDPIFMKIRDSIIDNEKEVLSLKAKDVNIEAVITDLQTKDNRLDGDIKQAARDASSAVKTVAGVNDKIIQVGGIDDSISTLRIQVDALDKIITTDTQGLAGLKNQVSINKGQLKGIVDITLPEILNKQNDLRSDLTNDITDTNKRVDTFQNGINQNEAKIQNVEIGMTNVNSGLVAQSTNIMAVQTDVSKLQGTISNIMTWENAIKASQVSVQNALQEITKHENAIKINEQKIAGNVAEIANVKNTAANNHTNNANNSKDIVTTQTDVAKLQGANTAMSSTLTTLHQDHNRLSTNQTSLNKQFADVLKDFVLVSADVKSNRKDIDLNKKDVILSTAKGNQNAVDITSVKVIADANKKTTADLKIVQDTQEKAISRHNTSIDEMEDGKFKNPLEITNNNTQIELKATGSHGELGIESTNGSEGWSIKSNLSHASKIDVQAESITFDTSKYTGTGLFYKSKYKTQAGTTITNTQSVLTYDNSSLLDESIIIYDDISKTWKTENLPIYLQALDYETGPEISQKIDIQIAAARTDFITTELSDYYTNSETYNKTEIDDALAHNLKNVSLTDIGSDCTDPTDAQEWSILKGLVTSSVSRPADSKLGIDINADDSVINAGHISDLQNKLNEILSALMQAGVFR